MVRTASSIHCLIYPFYRIADTDQRYSLVTVGYLNGRPGPSDARRAQERRDTERTPRQLR